MTFAKFWIFYGRKIWLRKIKVTFLDYRKVPDGMEFDETKIRVPSLLWIPLVIFVFLLYFVDVFQIQTYTFHPTMEQFADNVTEEMALKGYAINTPGCKIPELDPFDKNVRSFIEKPDIPLCNKGIPALFISNLTSVYLDHNSLPDYEVANASDLKCCYKAFWRIEPKPGQSDDKIESSKECHKINGSANIKVEFIEITCTYENSTIYTDMFAFVPVKNETKVTISNPQPLNVLIIGLDAISRINLHRQMPKTVNYLKDIKAVELLGYNKVGDNTFPNLIPALTGMLEDELTKSCWKSSNDYFDNCTFVWHKYKQKGYVTAYGEDASWMGLFNYQRRGFRKQTTDYAYNYFSRYAEKKIGNAHLMNVDQCEGARQVYRDLLTYINKFVTTMEINKLAYFGFFWGVSLSHDYLNKPKLGDDDYYNFFKNLNDTGYLNSTVVIFMSDHGIRWGGIRQTYQGRMEERLPFLIVSLPDWYKAQYSKAFQNLKRNARRLTTPFDLHETLVDLTNPFELTEDYLQTINYTRGISLFRAIPKNRTCEAAGIQSHWCTCQQSADLETNSSVVLAAANFAVNSINAQLAGYAQCASLSLNATLNARMMTHSSEIKVDNTVQDYMITIRTIPGEAVFEVTVRFTEKENKFEVMGTISRLNLYGKQSSCITDFHLKLYCYCKSLLS